MRNVRIEALRNVRHSLYFDNFSPVGSHTSQVAREVEDPVYIVVSHIRGLVLRDIIKRLKSIRIGSDEKRPY